MPTPFFADLVRELCQEGGTGPLTPSGAVPGHRRFAGTVPANTPFHYAVAGVAHSEEWEVGTGRLDPAGRIVRETIFASSSGGAAVDFAVGLKTIALTVAAGWFAAQEGAAATIEDRLAGKQPLSTTHEVVGAGDAGDLVTVRRGAGWVNLPMDTLGFRGASGRYDLTGPLGALPGTAAAPSISFAADRGSGLFLAGPGLPAIAAGGVERARLTASGALLLGAATNISSERLLIAADQPGTSFSLASNMHASGFAGYSMRTVGGSWAMRVAANGTLRWDQDFLGSGVLRLLIDTGGNVRPGTDNSQSVGAAPARWSVIYAGTGTINTSDAREKSWGGALTAAEQAAARRIALELGFYQWNHAIAAKGPGGARRHFGARAQQIWAIMADEGLIDPLIEGVTPDSRYAFLCHDAWAADETNGDAAGNRFGIRTDQLALFLIAAQDARLAALEAAA